MLMLFLRPGIPGPCDEDGNPVPQAQERVEYLISELDKTGTKVLIPTPALSEVLVRAGQAESQKIVEEVNKESVFSIEPFDQRAAIELAAMLRSEFPKGKVKPQGNHETWAKLKYDRQIVAIAKVCGVAKIYSDDLGIKAVAGRANITVDRVCELPCPPEDLQKTIYEELEE